MLSVIANSEQFTRDAIDVEFDSVAKSDQLKRGIKYNGLFLVGKEPVPAIVAPTVELKPAATKRRFRQIFEELIFGDTVA